MKGERRERREERGDGPEYFAVSSPAWMFMMTAVHPVPVSGPTRAELPIMLLPRGSEEKSVDQPQSANHTG